jgi:hypothetical protein
MLGELAIGRAFGVPARKAARNYMLKNGCADVQRSSARRFSLGALHAHPPNI